MDGLRAGRFGSKARDRKFAGLPARHVNRLVGPRYVAKGS
jgi:hypothetical protein